MIVPALIGVGLLAWARTAATQASLPASVPTRTPTGAAAPKGTAFVLEVARLAAPICQRTGTPLALAVAQACAETGWGRAVPAGNLFGIKGKGPAGSVNVPTREEFTPGKSTKIRDNFKAYNSWDQSIESWAGYITARRNRPPVSAPSAASWLVWIWAKGYATATKYPQFVASVSRTAAKRAGRPDLAITLSPELLAICKQLAEVPAGKKRWQLADTIAAKGWPA